jgi:hypothetical protein
MTLVAILAAGALTPLAAGAIAAPAGARLWSMWALGALLAPILVILCLAAQMPVAIAAVACAAIAIAGARRLWAAVSECGTASRTEWCLRVWLLLLLVCGIVVTLALPVLDSDAVVIWHHKAGDFLARLPFDEWKVPFYPPLGAVLWGVPLAIAGPEYETAGRCVFIACYVAWAASLRECCPGPLSPWAGVVIAGVALAALDHRFVTSGYQDPLLAAVGGMAAVWLARDLIDRRPGSATTGLALSGTLGLIKAEGLVLGLIMAGSWLGVTLAGRRRNEHPAPIAWRGVAMFVALTALWPAIRFAYSIGSDGTAFVESISPLLLWINRDRLPVIVDAFTALRPGYLLPMAAAAVALAAAWVSTPSARRAQTWIVLVLSLYTAATIAVFLITTAPLDWHLTTLLTRMVGQLLPIWYLAIVIAVRKD